jgi:hypothetical protein
VTCREFSYRGSRSMIVPVATLSIKKLKRCVLKHGGFHSKELTYLKELTPALQALSLAGQLKL